MAAWSRVVRTAIMVWLLGSSVHAQGIDHQQLLPWIEQGLKDGTFISLIETIVLRQSSKEKAEPSEVVNLLHQLVNMSYQAGGYRTSEALASAALRYAENNLGKEHPETLISVNNLALLYTKQGRYEEAEPLFQRALDVSERVLGTEHPLVLTIVNNVADLYSKQGRYREAEPLFQRAFKVRERVLGAEHPDTLVSVNNLALLYSQQGRYREAEPLFQRAFKIHERVLGAKHPQTLASMHNLAGLYSKQGHDEKAEPLLKQAFKVSERVLGAEHPQTLNHLNSLALLYSRQSRYREAEPLFQRVLDISERVLGTEHPQTLTSVNNLASLYSKQGDNEKAEPLFEHVFDISKRVLGAEHPQTLDSVNNLAGLYERQGRYEKAQALYQDALNISERVLGTEHPQTLNSVNNLAALYSKQGRYGEAEPLLKRALNIREQILGADHPQTITSVNNLASVYESQGRYGEAAPLYQRARNVRERVLGEAHPQTLDSINNLASLYARRGRYREAVSLYQHSISISKRVLGKTHSHTLQSVNNLASVYASQGRHREAEPLLKRTLDFRKHILGAEHPQTLSSVNNLASVYLRQGRYREAEPLFHHALNVSERVLGEAHPQTLTTQINYIFLLVNMKNMSGALQALKRLEPHLFTFTALQLQTTIQQRVRRQFLFSQAAFQDIVFSLAVHHPAAPIHAYASGVLLRWKRLQADEDAHLASLVRTATDPKLKKMGQRMMTLRSRLSQLLNFAQPDATEWRQQLDELEAQEAALATHSRRYKQHLDARDVRLKSVYKSLPAGSALMELRQYHPVDFKTGKRSEPRLLALLLPAASIDGYKRRLVDLGTVSKSRSLWRSLRRKFKPKLAQKLYQTLFGQLDDQLARFDTLYVAPDDFLHMVALSRLILPDGHYWFERQRLRQVLTGRDLIPLEPRVGEPIGLVALGGMDYDTYETASGSTTGNHGGVADGMLHPGLADRISRFKALPSSGPEAVNIATSYRHHAEIEPQVWQGSEASEAKLKSLTQPPQVLHLATHGFYLRRDGLDWVRPMALSGLALSGANRGTAGHPSPVKEDGILYALEASSLNLEGTQLVTLSACSTGRGTLDYSDGVYGLVRAFRIAGSRNVLMTLWNVGDRSTRDFMERFYQHWFSSGMTDAALALDQTRRAFLTHPNRAWRNSHIWAPFVLVESQ